MSNPEVEHDFLTKAVRNALYQVLSKTWYDTPAASIIDYFDPSIMTGKIPDVIQEICAALYNQVEISLMEELTYFSLNRYKFPEKVRLFEALMVEQLTKNIDVVEDACIYQYEIEIAKQEEEIKNLEQGLADVKAENEKSLQQLQAKYNSLTPLLGSIDLLVEEAQAQEAIIDGSTNYVNTRGGHR